jgi:hypothetical protein
LAFGGVAIGFGRCRHHLGPEDAAAMIRVTKTRVDPEPTTTRTAAPRSRSGSASRAPRGS